MNNEMVVLYVRMPEEQRRRLRIEAIKAGMSLCEFIQMLLDMYEGLGAGRS